MYNRSPGWIQHSKAEMGQREKQKNWSMESLGTSNAHFQKGINQTKKHPKTTSETENCPSENRDEQSKIRDTPTRKQQKSKSKPRSGGNQEFVRRFQEPKKLGLLPMEQKWGIEERERERKIVGTDWKREREGD